METYLYIILYKQVIILKIVVGGNMKEIHDKIDLFNSTVFREFSQYAKKLDAKYYEKAVDIIIKCESKGNRIHISGIGKPHHIATYMASLFSSTGTPCYFLDGTEATHGSSGQVLPGDVVICISYYGNVPELMKTVKTLKRNGAFIIAITGFNDSWIAQNADIHLNCHVEREGDSLDKPPRTSMLITLYLLMGLSIYLQEKKGMTQEKYVMYHPSGELGKM